MINNLRASSAPLKRGALFPLLVSVLLAASAGCQSSGPEASKGEARGIVVVNAPAAGEVSRVFVREGMSVDENAPLIEIAVREEMPAPAESPGESAEARAARNYRSADAEIEAARVEAVRHEAEVQRLAPLVASGEALQGQLDGERALYERAQQRLQQAQDAKKRAETGLLAARQPVQKQSGTAEAASRMRVVTARASSRGTVSAITVEAGARVEAGQPLATLRAVQR